MKNHGGFILPDYCPRKKTGCQAYSQIVSTDLESFFCCGEHSDKQRTVAEDKYRVCFKGEHDDSIAHYDRRDLIHHASVLVGALAIIEELET